MSADMRVAIKCQCGGFYQEHSQWHPESPNQDEITYAIRVAMHCNQCGHNICCEFIDYNSDDIEVHSETYLHATGKEEE
tara:strand:+ start:310 stop:546 length:237 start_codon:yes stop_codon:yes gene_type:complete